MLSIFITLRYLVRCLERPSGAWGSYEMTPVFRYTSLSSSRIANLIANFNGLGLFKYIVTKVRKV